MIANLAQMVNVIAPIFTNGDGLFLQSIYHPLKLCEIETTIQLADATFEEGVTTYEVTGESYGSINSFDRQAVGVSERSVQTGGQSFEHSFPACSITVLRAGLAG